MPDASPVIVLGRYVTGTTPILCRCTLCSQDFKARPSMLLAGQKCRSCAYALRDEARRYSHTDYLQQLNNARSDLEVVDTYRGTLIPIAHRCLRCQNVWNLAPGNAKRGSACPNCSPRYKEYKLGRRKVLVRGSEPVALDYMIGTVGIKPSEIVVDSEGTPSISYRFAGQRLIHRPDFWLPERNILVEVKTVESAGFYGTFWNKNHMELIRKLQAKAKAATKEGYRYKLLTFKDTRLYDLPVDWPRVKPSSLILHSLRDL